MRNFSSARCPKCEAIDNFKAELTEVSGYNFKLTAISCGKCNTVITFMEYYNIGAVLEKIRVFFKIP